ncbi:MAG: hypothetical protein Q9196_004504 [Gyalolechia fulgens]
MADNGKRKSDHLQGGLAAKKAKKQWQVPKKNLSIPTINPGDAGIWATCDMHKEGLCTVELKNFFNQYADLIYGDAITHGTTVQEQNLDVGDDIEAEINKEVQGMQSSKQEALFVPVKIDVQCVLFFKTREPVEPVSFVQRICETASDDKATKRTRFVKRLTPMTRMGKATEKGLEEIAKAVLGPVFHGGGTSALKFAIRPTIRNHHTMKRDDIIKQVAEKVGKPHTVDLKHYDRLILVDVYRSDPRVEMTELDSRRLPPPGMLTAPVHVQTYPYLQQYISSTSVLGLQDLVQQTMLHPSVEVARVEDRPNHLHPISIIHLSNGSCLTLKAGPSPLALLLRHERCMLDNEALTLQVLGRSSLPVPRLLKYDPTCSRLGSPFLLTTFLPGACYAELQKRMPAFQCAGIERQMRLLNAAIGQYVPSANNSFGLVALAAANRGHRTWKEAFTEMLESVLMDAEDLLINLPYAQLRDALFHAGGALDDVREPSLVVLGLSDPRNILIDRQTNTVTGLLDLGRALWGDWQMGAVEEAAGSKGSLYTIYHAVVAIVKHHYRRQTHDDELDARKSLTTALEQLAPTEIR